MNKYIIQAVIQQATLLNPSGQVITDAMLTEESTFYMASEDEENVYLQLVTI